MLHLRLVQGLAVATELLQYVQLIRKYGDTLRRKYLGQTSHPCGPCSAKVDKIVEVVVEHTR